MSRVYELLIHTLTAPYTWFLVLLHSEATRWSYKWLEWVKELDQCSGFLCKPSRNINKCSADISQELTDGQMTQYTCSVFHIALYSPLKRQKRSGLRPRRCHRSTLIAFGLSVRTGRTHLKYTHTETLCTCTYVNEYVYVCVCPNTAENTAPRVFGWRNNAEWWDGQRNRRNAEVSHDMKVKTNRKKNTQHCDVLVSYSTQRRIKAFTLKLHPVPENLISQYPIISQHRRRCGLRGLH